MSSSTSTFFNNLISKLFELSRSCYKRIVRYFTGQCEVVRICHSNNMTKQCHSNKMSLAFAKSIYNSKKLMIYKKIIFPSLKNFKPFNVSAALDYIIEVKRLNHTINEKSSLFATSNGLILKANITHSLHALRLCNVVFVHLDQIRKENFDKSNKKHFDMLETFWNNLKPDVKRRSSDNNNNNNNNVYNLNSKDWGDVGFQSDDPTTDFRGMGMLGLTQLLYFSQHKVEIASLLLLESNNPNRYFPFAATGINITSFVMELYSETRLHKNIFDNLEKIILNDLSNYEDGPSTDYNTIQLSCNIIHDIYCEVYYEFYKLWMIRNPTDIMSFPTIYNELKNNIRNKYPTL